MRITVGPEGKEATELQAEMLLVAAGRATNVEDVGLETTSAEVDRGIVKVDDHMRTKEPHLYAIGDIVGGLMLAHTAAHEGITAVHTIAGDPDVHGMDYVKQPRATYCRPEIASVGLTEQQCEERGLAIKVAKVPFQAIGKALIGGEYEGFAKIIANKETDETLGIHLIGPHATDLIAEASLALTLEAVPWEIGLTTHAHPTLLGDPRRDRDGSRRTVDQLLRPDGRRPADGSEPGTAPATEDAMTVTDRGGDAATSALAASVGLTDADLLAMYRTVALARAVDERMWILNRAGRIPFVISGQGHEGAQVGLAWPLRQGHDWVAPYYRSIATCLAFGLTARDMMLAQYAKAIDPSSGGRQMPGHYGHAEHHVVSVSSPVATQILHAVGIAMAAQIRKVDQVAVAIMGEGSSNQGDVHEALNFAAIHKLPFVFIVENNGYAICVPAEKELSVKDVAIRASGYGIPGVDRRRDRRARLLRGRPRGDRPRALRRRADAHRGQGHPADRPQLGRPADEVPDRGGPGRGPGARPAADLPRAAPRRRRADRRARGRARRRDRRARRGRDRLRGGRARPGPVHRRRPRVRRGVAERGAAAVASRCRGPAAAADYARPAERSH